MQNELKNLPGFFFYPLDKEGLVELSFEDRVLLLTNQGNYMVPILDNPYLPGYSKIGTLCLLDNSRIPTHRSKEAKIPGYGSVPFDLVEIKES